MTVLKGRAVSYLRLSKDDVSKGKYKKFEASNSIVNQRAIVERTVNKYPDLKIEIQGHICCQTDGKDGYDMVNDNYTLSINPKKLMCFIQPLQRFIR